ncbi:MAG: hypothetical protein REI45_04175, partial [Propionicimonas sp.]|nr:hypothetical protein [Propionicimonas sp.]
MSQLPRPAAGASGWLGRRLVFALVTGVVVLLGLGAWANALAEPVVRAGVPTGSVSPPPPRATPTRTPSPTGSATPSQPATPAATAAPTKSAQPAKEPT